MFKPSKEEYTEEEYANSITGINNFNSFIKIAVNIINKHTIYYNEHYLSHGSIVFVRVLEIRRLKINAAINIALIRTGLQP